MKTVFLARSVPGSWIFTIGDAVAISNLLLSKSTWLLNDRRGAVCPQLPNCISGQHDAERWKPGHKQENLYSLSRTPARLRPALSRSLLLCDLGNILAGFKP